MNLSPLRGMLSGRRGTIRKEERAYPAGVVSPGEKGVMLSLPQGVDILPLVAALSGERG